MRFLLDWFRRNHAIIEAQRKPHPLIITDDQGFEFEGHLTKWDSISLIRLSLHDNFATDSIVLEIETSSGRVIVTEHFGGFDEFVKILHIKFPTTGEPLEFLSRNAFSTETFEIPVESQMDISGSTP